MKCADGQTLFDISLSLSLDYKFNRIKFELKTEKFLHRFRPKWFFDWKADIKQKLPNDIKPKIKCNIFIASSLFY